MKKKVLIFLLILITFSLNANVFKQEELTKQLKEYLSYRTDKDITFTFEKGFKDNDKYKIDVIFTLDNISFTLPLVYSENNIRTSIEDSFDIALTSYLKKPENLYIKGRIENKVFGTKSDYRKGAHFYALDVDGVRRALFEKVSETENYDIYDTVYSDFNYAYFPLVKGKGIKFTLSPLVGFKSLYYGAFIDMTTLSFIYPFSFNLGSLVMYNNTSKLTYSIYAGLSYTANISSFTKSKTTMAEDAQFNVCFNMGYGNYEKKNTLYFSSRVSYTHMVDLYFAWGLELGYNKFYFFDSKKSVNVYTIALPLKVIL